MNKQQRIDIIGRIGEKIVINHLSKNGCVVEESIDPYDSEKDFIVDGKTAEVKTEQPFVMQNAFSFRSNQIRKCKSVDVLYFVSIPPLMKLSYKWGGWLFKADPKAMKTRTYETKKGINMILVDIEQSAITPIEKLAESEIEQLLKYAASDYK